MGRCLSGVVCTVMSAALTMEMGEKQFIASEVSSFCLWRNVTSVIHLQMLLDDWNWCLRCVME